MINQMHFTATDITKCRTRSIVHSCWIRFSIDDSSTCEDAVLKILGDITQVEIQCRHPESAAAGGAGDDAGGEADCRDRHGVRLAWRSLVGKVDCNMIPRTLAPERATRDDTRLLFTTPRYAPLRRSYSALAASAVHSPSRNLPQQVSYRGAIFRRSVSSRVEIFRRKFRTRDGLLLPLRLRRKTLAVLIQLIRQCLGLR